MEVWGAGEGARKGPEAGHSESCVDPPREETEQRGVCQSGRLAGGRGAVRCGCWHERHCGGSVLDLQAIPVFGLWRDRLSWPLRFPRGEARQEPLEALPALVRRGI